MGKDSGPRYDFKSGLIRPRKSQLIPWPMIRSQALPDYPNTLLNHDAQKGGRQGPPCPTEMDLHRRALPDYPNTLLNHDAQKGGRQGPPCPTEMDPHRRALLTNNPHLSHQLIQTAYNERLQDDRKCKHAAATLSASLNPDHGFGGFGAGLRHEHQFSPHRNSIGSFDSSSFRLRDLGN
jgi:hypothetical protein